MEILQLRYFLESAENQNFAKTAEKYNVPATSVSAAVKRLEKELGCELFNRTSNRILLNNKGRQFQQSLRLIFKELDNAVDSIASASIDIREIKMLVRAMRGQITNHIIDYKRKHPHISFKTVFDFDDKNFENYDIIIDEKSDNYPDYERVELYTSTVRLRASSNSALCGKKLTLKQLSNQPFISVGENNGIHKILIGACKQAGFTPNIVVLSNDLSCIEKCVKAGVGIGLGREYPLAKKSKNIEFLNVSDFNETQTVCVYYKKQNAFGNVEHFLNFLKSKARAVSQ